MSSGQTTGSATPEPTARLPWAMLAVTVCLVTAMVPLSIGGEPVSDTVLFGLGALLLGTIGALAATRQPGNAIGEPVHVSLWLRAREASR